MTTPITRVPPAWQSRPLFQGAGLTHTGAVRDLNEDSILTDPSGHLWAVADGMGGHGHGDLASDMVIEALATLPDSAGMPGALVAQIERANTSIRKRTLADGIQATGATCVAMMIQDATAHIAWAGDCRAYLMRSGALRLLTRDHTVVQELVEQGLLSEDGRETHPQSHVVTQAVGYTDEIEVEARSVPLVAGDRLLMCSDGLTATTGDGDIAAAIEAARTPEGLCQRLVAGALERGAPDNISVIAVFAETA